MTGTTAMGFKCVLRVGVSRAREMVWVSLASISLTHLPQKEQSTQTVQGRGSTAPQVCSLPVPSDLISFPSPQLPQVCVEDTLTSQGMLRHTEAQGLQPVVDVRFSHRKLEFCGKKGVHCLLGLLGHGRSIDDVTWFQDKCLVCLP